MVIKRANQKEKRLASRDMGLDGDVQEGHAYDITATSPPEHVLRLANNENHKDCTKCNQGCMMGSGVLAEGDSEKIADYLGMEKEVFEKEKLEDVERFNKTLKRPKLIRKGKPYGPCIFFNKRTKCMINDVKPFECRTAVCGTDGELTSQWFMLNHFVEKTDGESLRQWKRYTDVAERVIPGGKIEELVKDEKLRDKLIRPDWEEDDGRRKKKDL